MRKDIRKKKIQQRRNFFPTLIVITISWLALFALIYLVEPTTAFALTAFFLLTFFTFFLTFSTLFANSRRGFLIAIALSLFLFLRYLGVGHIINFLLLAGIVIALELYFLKKT